MSAMSFGKSKKRTGFRIPEQKLCPTCWNAMKEVGKGVWVCAKHGDSRIWENRHRKPAIQVESRRVAAVAPAIARGGLPEELRQFIAGEGERYKLKREIKEYLLACFERGENPNQAADRLWRELGYKNAEAAKGSFYKVLRSRKSA